MFSVFNGFQWSIFWCFGFRWGRIGTCFIIGAAHFLKMAYFLYYPYVSRDLLVSQSCDGWTDQSFLKNQKMGGFEPGYPCYLSREASARDKYRLYFVRHIDFDDLLFVDLHTKHKITHHQFVTNARQHWTQRDNLNT